jgi:SAM-dependent MidA family methyltransferase
VGVDALPWRDAWHDALYAAGRGFYATRGGPAEHFTTATHGVTGAVLAQALLRLWLREHDHLPAVVVDVGAGRGELATHLLASLEATSPVERSRPDTPDRRELGTRRGGGPEHGCVRVVAVDVVERPEGLDERICWVRAPGGAGLPAELTGLRDVLVIAHEWLDVVPCTIAEVDAVGTARIVLVDPRTGVETLGPEPSDADRRWIAAHWPTTTPGNRIEVGLARDEAWAELVTRVDSGLLVAVDYGHTRGERPSGGTLTAYRRGMQGDPVPDGTMDLTAHVAVDSLDGEVVGRQRDVLRGLGVLGQAPPQSLATSDPLGYLRALERASAEAGLIRPGGFGDFWWVVKRVAGRDVT